VPAVASLGTRALGSFPTEAREEPSLGESWGRRALSTLRKENALKKKTLFKNLIRFPTEGSKGKRKRCQTQNDRVRSRKNKKNSGSGTPKNDEERKEKKNSQIALKNSETGG